MSSACSSKAINGITKIAIDCQYDWGGLELPPMTVADVDVFPDLSLYFWAQLIEPTGAIMNRVFHTFLALGLAAFSPAVAIAQPADPLPSWNDGEVKHAIIQFVTSVITEGSPYFVPADQWISIVDNDGTLWA